MNVITSEDIRYELDAMLDESDESGEFDILDPNSKHPLPRDLGAKLTLYGVFYSNRIPYSLDEALVGIYDSVSVATKVAAHMQEAHVDDERDDVRYYVHHLHVGELPETQMSWWYYE